MPSRGIINIKVWTPEHLIHIIIAPKLMYLGFSIVTDILFITKHKHGHKFGPNSNIEKNLSGLDSPGSSREAKKRAKTHFV